MHRRDGGLVRAGRPPQRVLLAAHDARRHPLRLRPARRLGGPLPLRDRAGAQRWRRCPTRCRTEANKVRGCASQVWLASTARAPRPGAAPVLALQGDSDAHIVRGLIAILFAMYQDKTAEEILRADARALFAELGLEGAPHAAALERLLLHGRAHPQRCARACRRIGFRASQRRDRKRDPRLTRDCRVRAGWSRTAGAIWAGPRTPDRVERS